LILTDCGVSKIQGEVGWPRFRGPTGDGISRESDCDPEALAGGPRLLWRTDVGRGLSNVVIKNNRLYIIGSKPEGTVEVLCLDAETGAKIWQHSLDEPQPPYSTPTLDGKYVYVLSHNGILLCLRAKNEKIQWKKDIVNEFQVEKTNTSGIASLG